MSVSSRLLCSCFVAPRSVTFYRHMLWLVFLLSAGLSASESGYYSSRGWLGWASASAGVYQKKGRDQDRVKIIDSVSGARAWAYGQAVGKWPEPVTAYIFPVTSETANVLTSSDGSVPEESQSAASISIAADMEKLNATLKELLATV